MKYGIFIVLALFAMSTASYAGAKARKPASACLDNCHEEFGGNMAGYTTCAAACVGPVEGASDPAVNQKICEHHCKVNPSLKAAPAAMGICMAGCSGHVVE